MILIGYSGHAYVVCSIVKASGAEVTGYCDAEEKEFNPFGLLYFGMETSDRALEGLRNNTFFIAIGDNSIRKKIYESMASKHMFPVNITHPSAIICPTAVIAEKGIMISAAVVINPLVNIGKGSICNTGCIIEHECVIEEFVHIGPGAILCGNVSIGRQSFIGAGAVIRQGIKIGQNTMIGAGAIVVKDVPDNATVTGNPAR